MPTVIGPSSTNYMARVSPAVVQIKRSWGDQWETRFDLRAESASTHVAAADLDAAVISRIYGPVKEPWESAIGAKVALDLANAWVQILLVAGRNLVPIWLGRVAGEGSDPRGNSLGPSGVQQWQCYGPRNLLRRIHVHQSYWLVDGEEALLDWLPAMNGFNAAGGLVGNRHEDGNYYGGTEIWTHRQYAEYLIERFVDESSAGGPSWSLGGQADLLDNLESAITFGRSPATAPTTDYDRSPGLELGGMTADQILSALIPIDAGCDWKIVATNGGFEICVFSLSAESCTYGGQTLPANPSQVVLYTNRSHDSVRARVCVTNDHNYGTIRVLGKRVVVCCSLYGANVEGAQRTGLSGSLVSRWASALETEYKAGTGDSSDRAEAHDGARRDARYASVFSHFGAPANWDFMAGHAAPELYEDGDGMAAVREGGDAQKVVRETLPWLPLRHGVDYTQNPPAKYDANAPDGDLHVPLVGIADADGHWHKAEDLGFSIAVPRTDWGVVLRGNPQHLLALNHWTAAAATDWQPVYDYSRMFCTIAILTDRRLVLEATRSDASPSDGILTIECDAEFWYVAERTTFYWRRRRTNEGDDDDELLATTGDMILRNDSDRMRAVMAGAIARYFRPRARADIQIVNTLAWGELTGQILQAVEQGGIYRAIDGPITSVEWHWPPRRAPYTVIKGGYAL